MPGNKARSKYAKKRKFVGIRRQDITKDDDNQERPNNDNIRPGPSSTPDKLNKSLEKINENCPILKAEREQLLTRQKAFDLGSTRKSLNRSAEAFGNHIISSKLLSMAMEKIAICKICRSPKSCLKLFQENGKRSGLDESLFFKVKTAITL